MIFQKWVKPPDGLQMISKEWPSFDPKVSLWIHYSAGYQELQTWTYYWTVPITSICLQLLSPTTYVHSKDWIP